MRWGESKNALCTLLNKTKESPTTRQEKPRNSVLGTTNGRQ